MEITTWYWALAVLAGIGCVLNVWQRKEGFILWVFTNLAWTFHFVQENQYAQAFQFAVQTLLAIYGIATWHRKKNTERRINSLWLDWQAMKKWASTRHGRQPLGF
jgi:nicotinamide riboside transporter PnuC